MVSLLISESVFFVIGLSLGSFANVCIYRIPRRISVVAPRSFCPHCERTLAWYELVPILSFLILRGKCRTCGFAISLRYPLVELVTGVISICIFSQNVATADALVKITLLTLLLTIAVIDWTSLIIPNGLVFAGLLLGSVTFVLISTHALMDAALSAVFAVAFTFLARAIGNFMFKKETMGMGDVKLAALVGFIIGFEYFLFAVWLAAIVGIVFWIFQHIVKGADGDFKLPFGSFLSAASLLIYLSPVTIFQSFPNSTIPLFQLPFIH